MMIYIPTNIHRQTLDSIYGGQLVQCHLMYLSDQRQRTPDHILYILYTVQTIYCTDYILYILYTVQTTYCTDYILYRLYTVLCQFICRTVESSTAPELDSLENVESFARWKLYCSNSFNIQPCRFIYALCRSCDLHYLFSFLDLHYLSIALTSGTQFVSR